MFQTNSQANIHIVEEIKQLAIALPARRTKRVKALINVRTALGKIEQAY